MNNDDNVAAVEETSSLKDFLRRNVVVISVLAFIGLVATASLSILLVGASDLQIQTLARADQTVLSADDLPGPKGNISERSKSQLATILKETPHIQGGWIAKLKYEKTEVPILYFWAREDIVTTLMSNYRRMQESGHGYSSAELNAQSEQSLRNSEEAKTGLIKCGPLESSNLPKIEPKVLELSKAVCRATIPPFDSNVNLAIVIVIDIAPDDNDPAIQAIRRALLQLQIDIFNRDYQGRETWARAI